MKHNLNCKYCGKSFDWTFVPDSDFETLDDILEYDYEVLCPQCGCNIRVNESLTEEGRIKLRLEYLRGEIEVERISYGEIAELQSLKDHIDDGDVVLLEWAGVPEK